MFTRVSPLVINSLLLWGIQLSQAFLFKRSSATTDYLENTSRFVTTSNIECASACLVKMNQDECTAYSRDDRSGVCTCGKKKLFKQRDSGTAALLHIANSCPATNAGKSRSTLGSYENLGMKIRWYSE